ncbi:MAG TPA: indole-3-glycerol phosphate synthase TrpC [Archaeoglobaceae archaeon]|nr:indole-3-glycerol phosphate synthase TrpC [Archaeoglobaceae archaeon]
MGIVSKKGDILKKIRECRERGKNAVIAEIKVYSPKYGDLLRGRSIDEILGAYERAGATGISYITESKNFNGNFETLREICSKTELPVLRKDFILSKNEVEKTAEANASVILLIARMLKEDTAEFVDYSFDHGLEPLVEVHNPEDIEIALNTSANLIGINNRDISKLETDDGTVNLTKKLAKLIPEKRTIVSESGISTIEDLRCALKHADAVLIGTAFMKAENIEEFVRNFVGAKLC